MNLEQTWTGTPESVNKALGDKQFAVLVLSNVLMVCLGVEDVGMRPAEYSVETPREGVGVTEDVMGVQVRLTGVTRDGRTNKQLHDAKRELMRLTARTVEENLPEGQRCQVYAPMLLDCEVETQPNSGEFRKELAEPAVWVDGRMKAEK